MTTEKKLEENAFLVENAEAELKEIDKLFSSGELNAFGGREESILKQIDGISQLQIRAFLSSMEIELK
jgi:hypothetical protein